MIIRDERLEIRLDDRTGGVTAIVDSRAGALLSDDDGGSLFVLETPRGGDRTVVVRTADQVLAAAEPDDDGRRVRLRWDGVTTSTGERLGGFIEADLAVRAGSLVMRLVHELDTEPVEAVRFPSLRGLRAGDGGPLEFRGVDYSTGTRIPLLPVFDNNSPYWGTTFPDYASGNLRPELVANPTSPFVLLAGDRGGLAVLPSTPTLEFIGWRVSLEPGYQDSMARSAGDATVTLDAIQMPVPGGSPREMTLAPYGGPWTSGLDAYTSTHGPTRRSTASWLNEPRSWLQIQLMSTEGEPRYDFTDLISVIEECAREGIGAIQIVGWNEGGQDGLVPVHRPAEKLGGEAGLRAALDRARELDVQAVLYVKYQWVEKPGPSWDDLAAFVCLDENGQPYAQPGPVYHSARKRYGMSTPWYVPLCFGVAELRARFAAEVAQLAGWGAAGILADESLYHGRALLCFASDHGHAPGASTYLWDGEFVEDLRAAVGDRADEFAIVAEGAYDSQFEHYDASYFRSASARHVPLGRMLRPDARIITALIGFDDRNMANQCLLYGYAASLEPYNFKGRPSDMPKTVEYVRAVDELRSRFAPWLWNGALETAPGVVAEPVHGGEPLLAVWSSPGRAERLVVLANPTDETCEFGLRSVDAESVVVRVEGGEESFDGRIALPPRGAALVAPRSLLTAQG